jgi:hypothetical protein
MGIDLKIPIGLMFTILGILLIFEGLITFGDEIYQIKSLGYNINLWSGSSMLLFGSLMLLLSWFGKNRNLKGQYPDHKSQED